LERIHHLRSLLSSETLEDHLSVAVNAEVRDSLRVDCAGTGISPALHSSNILEGRKGATAEGLHGVGKIEKNRRKRRNEREERVKF